MGSLNRTEKNKPTNPKAKFVAPAEAQSRRIRRLLAGLLRFIRRARRLPRPEGDLSLWLCQMHGLGLAYGSAGQNTSFASLNTEALQPFAPGTDPAIVRKKIAESEVIASGTAIDRLIESAKLGDATKFNKDFEEIVQKIKNVWLPGFQLPLQLSFPNVLALIRATRALLICTALHGTHPLILIARAWRNERQAVLDLVKVDELFLVDRCTQNVIRDAALQEDQDFFNQLAHAQTNKMTVRVRDLFHIYFYVLFLWESLGRPLPRIDELQRLLDPRGKKYKGLYAFEKDFQRGRAEFREMLANGEQELPFLRSFYSSVPANTT